MTVVHGIPVTSPSRTLIDLGEMSARHELRGYFANARAEGLLDFDELEAALERVEWRPSLYMVRQVMEEFRE